MVRRPARIRSVLWFLAIGLAAMGLPLQVYAGAPYPVLLPYVVIVLILAIAALRPRRPAPDERGRSRHPGIGALVLIFLFSVFFNTAWQAAFGLVSPFEAASALTIYVLPTVFYWYFRRAASEREVRAVMWGIAAFGLVIAVYFAYDSYLKLALGEVSTYARAVVAYAAERSGQAPQSIDVSRANPAARAYGLMETHAVSGTWTVFGALASVALLDPARRTLRRAVLAGFGAMLLVGLNVTTMLAYLVVVFVFEFGGLELLRARINKGAGRNIAVLVTASSLIVGGIWWMAGDAMSSFMARNLSTQLDLAFGTGQHISMVGIFLNNVRAYFGHIAGLPLTAAFGDGFTSYGGAKGGDVGFIETLERFGLPLYTAVVWGVWRLMRAATRQMRAPMTAEAAPPVVRQFLRFAVCATVLIAVTELHYTVWSTKPVIPIVFFTLALYERYLPPRRVPRLARANPQVAA